MLDHIGIQVRDIDRAKAFYLAALAPLGYRLYREFDAGGRQGVGLVAGRIPDFWIYSGSGSVTAGLHIAFSASDRGTVDAFYQAALAAGGTANGAPGERPQYHPSYYGAFVFDADGHNVEAVCHLPA